jgi:hypothetical protein
MNDEFETAERLMREAQERAERAGAEREVPPNGWASPGSQPPHAFPDLGALIALVESLRGQIPPELARQLQDALRELLIAIRAVLDYSIQRLEPSPPPERTVEDIPIT